MGGQPTILVTFAGRRDRMQLLTRYVGAAIERGLIDEWHVRDFAATRTTPRLWKDSGSRIRSGLSRSSPRNASRGRK